MKRILIAMAVACLPLQAFAANTVFLTTRADVASKSIDAGLNLVGPPLANIDTLKGDGKVYTNEFVAGFAGIPGLTTQRAILSATLGQYLNGTTYTPIFGPNTVPGNATQLLMIAVVQGVTVLSPTATTALVDFDPSANGGLIGRLGVWEIAAGSYNANDPTTWGITVTGDGPGGMLVHVASGAIAEWQQKLREPVKKNNGDAVEFAAAQVNTGSLDQVAGQQQTQSRVLFREDSPTNASPGDGFITTKPWPPNPQINADAIPVNNIIDEAIFGTTADVIETTAVGLTPAMVDVLNALGMWGLAAPIAGIDTGWATVGAGQPTDWVPFFLPIGPGGTLVNVTGDFNATDQVAFNPGIQTVIPEPGSVAIWGLGLLAGAFLARRRMVRKAS
jgi:hypothetical protein